MKIKNQFILLFFSMLLIQSCKSQIGGFYTFDLFKNAPVYELAKAIENENVELIKTLISRKNININFQEPKFGNTLLITAICNGKVKSVETLLINHADLLIKNKQGKAAINEASDRPSGARNSFEILKLLLKYGADVNQIEYGNSSNKGFVSLPIAGAVSNLNCAKLLLEKGGNIYFKANNFFIVWTNALNTYNTEGILFIRYIIIDKKSAIPLNLGYGVDKTPNDIYHYLNSPIFPKDPVLVKAKEDILAYLKQINFPKNQLYMDTSSNHVNPLLSSLN